MKSSTCVILELLFCSHNVGGSRLVVDSSSRLVRETTNVDALLFS